MCIVDAGNHEFDEQLMPGGWLEYWIRAFKNPIYSKIVLEISLVETRQYPNSGSYKAQRTFN
ncbi:hypothetical protein Ocin01_15433 [Orchesella cincta]|uniref:Uncharacterized protein n=1 Tax=Orchesella cincta TaxID=48709 RepID=A0A1D2MEE5_ORCCI|nr:hypothetical protein Ocin01_15433 [Orchesella cincta]